MGEWKDIQPGVFRFEKEGDSMEGILLVKRENVGVNNSKAYIIENNDKEQLHVWGSTVLDDKMQLVKEGDKIRIIFKGIQKNAKKQDTKIFQVLKFEE